MYNGIGLTTPRGSGTSGYVVRNLSHMRHHETPAERAAAFDVAPVRHREPDKGILEHERKRKVEVRCLELQVELEDKGVDDETVQVEVEALRKRLLDDIANLAPSAKNLKLSDTHGRAAAKKSELDKMARALGTKSDYIEGAAFDRERQEELKQQRTIDRAEREKQREEEREKREKEKEKWEAMRKEKDRLRRRQEDQERKAREERGRMPPPPPPMRRDRSPRNGSLRGSRSPPPRRIRGRSRSPPARRSRSPVSGRSRSPPRRRSPPVRRTRSPPLRRTRSPPLRRTRSPPRRRATRSPSPSRRLPRSSGGPPVRHSDRGRALSPISRTPSRERHSPTGPSTSRRFSSRSPPRRHVSPSPPPRNPKHDSPPHRRAAAPLSPRRENSPSRHVALSPPRRRFDSPPRRSGFGERVVDDRSPPERTVLDDRSSSPKQSRYSGNGRRSMSRSSSGSGSAMSVSGSDD